MKTILKRSISLLLALVLILGNVPMAALATEAENFDCDPAEAVIAETQEAEIGELVEQPQETAPVAEETTPVVEETTPETEEEVVFSEAITDVAADKIVEIPVSEADGLVWLDKENQDALTDCVLGGGLTDLVLDAVGYEKTSKTAVFYTNNSGSSYDVGLSGSLLFIGNELLDALQNQKTLSADIKEGKNVVETVNIVFRNIRTADIRIGNVSITNAGEPADLANQIVNGLNNAAEGVKIYHNGDDLTALAAGDYEVHALGNDTYTWPGKGETKEMVGVTVSLKDALGVYTKTAQGKVILSDKTEFYTVTFNDGVADKVVFADIVTSLAKGSATPIPADPKRENYIFQGWTPEVAETVDATVTYKATWKPVIDMDGNGVSDLEQVYTVRFMDGTQVLKTINNVAWGTYTATLAKPADPVKEGFLFSGWLIQEDTITKDLDIQANWVEVLPDVYYVTYIYEDVVDGQKVTYQQVKKMLDDGTADPFEFPDTDEDTVIWSGWHTDAACTNKYTFGVKLTGALTLYGKWMDDTNNNGVEDGTAEDPYVIYYHMMWEKGTANNFAISEEKIFTNEGTSFDPEAVAYADENTEDTKIFDCWTLDEAGITGGTYSQVKTYYPTFTVEENQNGVADKDEQTMLVTHWAKPGVNPGTVYANGKALTANAYFTRDSLNGMEIKVQLNGNAVVTKISLKPVVPQTMSLLDEGPADEVGEIRLDLTYVDYAYVTAAMPADADARLEDGVEYSLNVYFADAKAFILKDPATVLSLVNREGFTQKEAYEAVIASPEYHDDATIEVKYIARAEDTIKVECKALANQINDLASTAGMSTDTVWNQIQKYVPIERVDGSYFYVYEQTQVEKLVDELPLNTTVTQPETLINNYLTKLKAKVSLSGFTDLIPAVREGHDELVAALAASNIHPFGYNAEEILHITYNDGRQILDSSKTNPEGITIQLEDPRAATTITVNGSMTFQYGEAGIDAKIMNNLSLSGAKINGSEQIVLNQSFEGLDVGTYTAIASFGGNGENKGTSKEFSVVITKAKATLTVNRVICDKQNFDYTSILPVTNPAGVKVLQVVAGLDITSGQLNPNAPYVEDIKAKAWINADQETLGLMEAIIGSGSYTLDEVKTILKDKKDQLSKVNVSEATANQIIKAMEEIQTYVDGQVDVIFGAPEIEAEGIYLNYAVAVDDNYIVDKHAYNLVLVTPVLPRRNTGGVQLTYNGQVEEVFAIPNEAESKALTVTYKGTALGADQPIFYYGVTNKAHVFNSENAPTEPGVYVASTIYYDDANAKLGSDTAIMLVGMTEADINVKRTVVVADGANHAADYTITSRKDGSAINSDITMISGTVNLNAGDEVSLSSLTADVYIDLPLWLGEQWETFKAGKVINKTTVLNFIDDCIRKHVAPANKLASMGVTHEYIDAATEYVGQTLRAVRSRVEQIPNVATIYVNSTKNYAHYSETGMYLYCAILTDSSVAPDADLGLLVIKGHEDELVMEDSVVYYDGTGKEPVTVDNTGRDGLTLIVDSANKSYKLLSDNTLRAAIQEVIEPKLGKSIYNNEVTIGEIQAKIPGWTDMVAQKVIDKAIAKVTSVTGGRFESEIGAVNELLDKMSAKLLKELKDQLNKLNAYSAYSFVIVDDTTENLPKEIGKYVFHTFSYSMVYAKATLEIIEPVSYTYSQNAQIKLIEPWGLKANAKISDENGVIDYDALHDYGVYFIRESALNRAGLTQATIKAEDIVNDSDAVKMTKGNGVTIDRDYLSAIYDNDIYTYELSDSVFVMFYVVTREGAAPIYAPIRERNLKELATARMDDAVLFPNALERAVYKRMVELEADITDYRSDFVINGKPEKQKAPTLGEYALGTPVAGSTYSYDYSQNAQIKLIEPWGMKTNVKVTYNGSVIDYNAVEEYGIVALADNGHVYTDATEILAKDHAYVFSSKNGDAFIDSGYISAIYSKGIFTYQLDTDIYVFGYVKDADGYHYGPVRCRNVHDLMQARKDDAAGFPNVKERNVYTDMVNLFVDITAYREDYFSRH